MVESIEVRQSRLEAAAGMPPPRPGLAALRKLGAEIDDRNACGFRRQDAPALGQQRHPAWRQLRHPHRLNRFRPQLQRRPPADHREKLRVDDVQVVAGREPVDWIEDVRSCPADELLADVERQAASRDGRRETPDRDPRGTQATILPVETPHVFDLVVRVRSEIDARHELQPGRRLDDHLLTPERVGDGLRGVVGRVLGKQEAPGFDEAGRPGHLRASGRAPEEDRDREDESASIGQFRSACTVKSESLRDRLY